jgi:hypothetical protein
MGGHKASPRDSPEARSRHQYDSELVSARPYEMATFASLIAAQAAVERSEWRDLLSRGKVDRCGRGVIDERGKRFSPAERRIAKYLAGHGSAVVSIRGEPASHVTADIHLRQRPGPGRRFDAPH